MVRYAVALALFLVLLTGCHSNRYTPERLTGQGIWKPAPNVPKDKPSIQRNRTDRAPQVTSSPKPEAKPAAQVEKEDHTLGLPQDITTATFEQLWHAAVQWAVGSYQEAVHRAWAELERRGTSILDEVVGKLPFSQANSGLDQRAFTGYFKAIGQDAHAPLTKLLETGDDKMRTDVMIIILEIKLTSAIPSIRALTKDEKLGFFAARICAMLGDKEVVPELKAMFEGASEPRRIQIIGSLSGQKDTALAPFYCLACGDDFVSVRRSAQNALVATGKGSMTDIIAFLDDGNTVRTRMLLEALGRLGGPDCVLLLMSRLDPATNGDWRIRFSAITALQKCKADLSDSDKSKLRAAIKTETNEQCRREYSRLLSEELEWKTP